MTELMLTDGGLETVLLFHEGLELPCFAAFPLVEQEPGREALRRYFEPFLATAAEFGMPFVLDTATWRANPDWGAELGYDKDALAQVNRAAVAFARELAAGRPDILINGSIGPRGDGYVVGETMSAQQAQEYHAPPSTHCSNMFNRACTESCVNSPRRDLMPMALASSVRVHCAVIKTPDSFSSH